MVNQIAVSFAFFTRFSLIQLLEKSHQIDLWMVIFSWPWDRRLTFHGKRIFENSLIEKIGLSVRGQNTWIHFLMWGWRHCWLDRIWWCRHDLLLMWGKQLSYSVLKPESWKRVSGSCWLSLAKDALVETLQARSHGSWRRKPKTEGTLSLRPRKAWQRIGWCWAHHLSHEQELLSLGWL